MSNTCRNCQFWTRHTDDFENEKAGKCSHDRFVDANCKMPCPNDGLRYWDDEEYFCGFETGEDFGCVHWQAKPDDEAVMGQAVMDMWAMAAHLTLQQAYGVFTRCLMSVALAAHENDREPAARMCENAGEDMAAMLRNYDAVFVMLRPDQVKRLEKPKNDTH